MKEKMKKADDRLSMLNGLTKLKQDLNNLGPVPYNVDLKTVYSYWYGRELKYLPVPKDVALYDYFIRFLNIISNFQDSEVLKLELFDSRNITQAKKLVSYVHIAGRSSYGYNRTKKGEVVTEDNVYLGDLYDMDTKNVRFWKNVKFDNQQFDDFVKYAIQICQIKSFLDHNVEPMKNLISEIMIVEEQYKSNLFDKIALYKQKKHR